MRDDLHDPFLRAQADDVHARLEQRRQDWGIPRSNYYRRLDRWFGNFDGRDKALALKLFWHIEYYDEAKFADKIDDYRRAVFRYLQEVGAARENLLLVVPDDRGDSADRHAYALIKSWGLDQQQIVTVAELTAADPGRVLVFFNDTHGTGNQFLREVAAGVDVTRFRATFIIAVTIAEKALRRFRRELPQATVLPGHPAQGVRDIFTSNEVRRLRELGSLVYPTHPLGFGDAGLLTVYHFQCPNNTLPLIWADEGTGNNEVDGVAYPWVALRPYEPKAKRQRPPAAAPPPTPLPIALLDPESRWCWTPDELERIVNRITTWGLSTPSFYERAGRWFGNFEPDQRTLALDVFLATTYLDVAQTRAGIRRIGETIIADTKAAGGDRGDVLLVTTGDRMSSVYHYVFDFLREWRLDVEQVVAVERLGPDAAIDKTLVFFYHTRSGDHFSRTPPNGPSYSELLSRVRPRAGFVAAYAMTPAARRALQPAPLAHLDEASRTVADLVPALADAIGTLEQSVSPGWKRAPSEELLVAYYFQCPRASSPLLWADNPIGARMGRPWSPLFRHVEIPR
jgi:hypothetical protein